MRALPVLLSVFAGPVTAQVWVEPEWQPPVPPPFEEFCLENEKISDPVVSYRISNACEISAVQQVGEYQYGLEQVKEAVRGFSSRRMVRRFEAGQFVHYNEVSIELHRATEPVSTLICNVDMMGRKVVDAKIVRDKVLSERRTIKTEEPVVVTSGQLPNLGVFTYTERIRYETGNCPSLDDLAE